jgi:hypothetical protein
MGMPLVNRAMATLAWGRMQRLAERFARLRARLEAGTLRPPRARGERDDEPAPEARPRVRVRRPWLPFLPRTFGWFARTVPGAGPAAQEFEMLLASPGMPALISVAPQAGRILRPLAHMLGVRRPEFLRLPRRKRISKPRTHDGGMPSAIHPSKPPDGLENARTQPPPPQPPPHPSRSAEEEAALAYARRPGGLYWNGTGFRWS